ncbi:hypothetical protein SERLA73DRAFT_156758 [Serpula lacrymans var. lacrymans S7.3]|uniref:Uncharacterized protein n=1 Tax=Serpula lacrymans var. lacrymans (strain S7.3) TaxID=936435 RepID=F8QFX0_SERL3|nr:hypothetical protein SERLA73DRAFT_156758 [Serpula lacrymans var. lacrymans S7.3]
MFWPTAPNYSIDIGKNAASQGFTKACAIFNLHIIPAFSEHVSACLTADVIAKCIPMDNSAKGSSSDNVGDEERSSTEEDKDEPTIDSAMVGDDIEKEGSSNNEEGGNENSVDNNKEEEEVPHLQKVQSHAKMLRPTCRRLSCPARKCDQKTVPSQHAQRDNVIGQGPADMEKPTTKKGKKNGKAPPKKGKKPVNKTDVGPKKPFYFELQVYKWRTRLPCYRTVPVPEHGLQLQGGRTSSEVVVAGNGGTYLCNVVQLQNVMKVVHYYGGSVRHYGG